MNDPIRAISAASLLLVMLAMPSAADTSVSARSLKLAFVDLNVEVRMHRMGWSPDGKLIAVAFWREMADINGEFIDMDFRMVIPPDAERQDATVRNAAAISRYTNASALENAVWVDYDTQTIIDFIHYRDTGVPSGWLVERWKPSIPPPARSIPLAEFGYPIPARPRKLAPAIGESEHSKVVIRSADGAKYSVRRRGNVLLLRNGPTRKISLALPADTSTGQSKWSAVGQVEFSRDGNTIACFFQTRKPDDEELNVLYLLFWNLKQSD